VTPGVSLPRFTRVRFSLLLNCLPRGCRSVRQMSTGHRGDYDNAIMQKRGFLPRGRAVPFGAKHRLDQRMNKGVPAGGDGWDAREAPPGMATGLAKRAGAALPPGSKTHIRHQYSRVLFAISFGSRKRVVSVASIGMPPGGSVIRQSASLPRENARRVFSRSLEGNLSTRDFGNISNPRGVW
jgi:hypothetical protein